MPAPRTVQLSQFLPYRLANLSKLISDDLSRIYRSEFAITVAEWRVLAHLAEHEHRNARDIGGDTGMDKVKVSRAVKSLVERKLVLRAPDDSDNRAYVLSLTGAGRRLYAQIAQKALAWEARLINSLHVTEYRDLFRTIDKLEAQLRRG